MALSPSLGDAGRQGSHFVSGGGQKVAVVSRHTRACPLVPPTMSSRRRRRRRVSLRSVSSRLNDEARDDVPLYHGPWVLLSSIPLRDGLPHPESMTSPLRETRPPSLLYPPHPLAVVAAAKCSPFPSLLPPPRRPLPTRPLPSSSPPALFHLQRRRSHPSHRSRDIITPFYSRFIGLYQLHCHRTVCIVAA